MRKIIAIALGLTMSLMGATVWASAVLFIGDPPLSGTYLYNGEVQPLNDATFGILENGNGQPTLDNPLKLIIGVPNTAITPPTLDFSGGNQNVAANSVAGTFSSGEIYSFLNLSATSNNSNSFTNWAAADLAVLNLTVTGFNIYYYNLVGTGITGGQTINIHLDGSLPNGTFVVAYGTFGDQNFSTPFTEAGLVPEPATVLLLGAGLLGVALYRRKFAK